MKIQFNKTYLEIISPENLFAAWQEFVVGKVKKKDVQEFSLKLVDNILQLSEELANFSYVHGSYSAFNISDPKPRNIHKASVRDRVLHHAIYRQLYGFFYRTFITDSYSCRVGKGTHKALNMFRSFGYKVSRNNTRTVWVLKCDIKKFFAGIEHKKLLEILAEYIPDKNILWLLGEVVGGFCSVNSSVIASASEESLKLDNQLALRDPSTRFRMHSSSVGMTLNKGLPLGNLTSQLFCNIYMNEFDQFVKHKLRIKYYIRYSDDFVFLSDNRTELEILIPKIAEFLGRQPKLASRPNKVFIKTLASGVDFLGWVNFPRHRVLRGATRRRMFKRLSLNPVNSTLQSYLGLICHGNGYKIKQDILNYYGILAQK